MAFFFSQLLIFCSLIALIYVPRSNKNIHCIILVKNQQHMIEWYIRKQIVKYSWRRVRLHVTIIDAGSTDATLRIVQTLAKKYSLQYFCVDNKEQSISIMCNLLATIDPAEQHAIGLVYV